MQELNTAWRTEAGEPEREEGRRKSPPRQAAPLAPPAPQPRPLTSARAQPRLGKENKPKGLLKKQFNKGRPIQKHKQQRKYSF